MMVESQNNGHVGTSNFCPLLRGVHSLEVRDVLALYYREVYIWDTKSKFTPEQSLSIIRRLFLLYLYLKYPLSEVPL